MKAKKNDYYHDILLVLLVDCSAIIVAKRLLL